MNTKSFINLNSAYQEILQDIAINGTEVDPIVDPLSIGSQFGSEARKTKEIIGYSFAIESPADRTVFLKSRQTNLPFAISNCIWTISGSDSLDFISLYNERGKQFSDDQTTLHGAHGKRLFNVGGINQIIAIINRLKKDPYSRRTVATIYHPTDNQAVSRDIPCPIAIQFLQRNGKLHAITYMRSQSAAMVLPYDIFLFTFIQEALAVELGLDLGVYYHTTGSFHYYQDEDYLVQEVIEENKNPSFIYDINVPQMPKNVSPFKMITSILSLENRMRLQAQESAECCKFQIPEMHEYWRNIVFILAIRILEKFSKDSQSYISHLPEYYSRHFNQF